MGRASDLRTTAFLILGPLFLLVGLWALAWLLTSHTVTATATDCGPAHTHHRHAESKCTVSWNEHGRSHSKVKSLDQPGAVGRQLQLVVGGLGPSGAVTEGNLELIASGLLGLGAVELGVGLLFRSRDKRSGRTGGQLGR